MAANVPSWGSSQRSNPIEDPGANHKFNFTGRTGITSVRDACEKLNSGYDKKEWPFPLAYVYSDTKSKWFAIYRDDFDKNAFQPGDLMEPLKGHRSRVDASIPQPSPRVGEIQAAPHRAPLPPASDPRVDQLQQQQPAPQQQFSSFPPPVFQGHQPVFPISQQNAPMHPGSPSLQQGSQQNPQWQPQPFDSRMVPQPNYFYPDAGYSAAFHPSAGAFPSLAQPWSFDPMQAGMMPYPSAVFPGAQAFPPQPLYGAGMPPQMFSQNPALYPASSVSQFPFPPGQAPLAASPAKQDGGYHASANQPTPHISSRQQAPPQMPLHLARMQASASANIPSQVPVPPTPAVPVSDVQKPTTPATGFELYMQSFPPASTSIPIAPAPVSTSIPILPVPEGYALYQQVQQEVVLPIQQVPHQLPPQSGPMAVPEGYGLHQQAPAAPAQPIEAAHHQPTKAEPAHAVPAKAAGHPRTGKTGHTQPVKPVHQMPAVPAPAEGANAPAAPAHRAAPAQKRHHSPAGGAPAEASAKPGPAAAGAAKPQVRKHTTKPAKTGTSQLLEHISTHAMEHQGAQAPPRHADPAKPAQARPAATPATDKAPRPHRAAAPPK